MSKKAFEKIAEGLNEALAITRGESKPVTETFTPPAAMADAVWRCRQGSGSG